MNIDGENAPVRTLRTKAVVAQQGNAEKQALEIERKRQEQAMARALKQALKVVAPYLHFYVQVI